MRIAPAILILLLPAVVVAVVDLDDPPGFRPYAFAPGMNQVKSLVNWSNSRGSAAVDIDGDGLCESAWLSEIYLQVHSYRDGLIFGSPQFNFPGRFVKAAPCGWVDGAWDLDGSGRPEIVVGSRTADGAEIRYWLLDSVTLESRLDFPLPVGEDREGEPIWDGYYIALGPAMVPTPEGPAPALVFACGVRYDEFGRGVLAVDVRNGRILWRADLANSLTRWDCHFGDADGDGALEILVCGAAYENLDPEQDEHVDGLRDDVPRIYCFDVDGSLRWRRDVAIGTGRLVSVLADTDGDGCRELAVCGTRRGTDHDLLIFDPADGALLARHRLGVAATGLVAAPVRPGRGQTLYLSQESGEVRRLQRRDDRFIDELFARSRSVVMVQSCEDILPSPGPELAVSLTGNGLALLGPGGDWLLLEPCGTADVHAMEVLPMGGGRVEIALPESDGEGRAYLVIDVPRPFPWLPVSTASAALALAGLAFRLRRRAPIVASLDLRSRRLLLLERLEQMDHNRIGALHAVRDLSYKLAVAGPTTPGRATAIVRRLQAKVLPRLHSILDLAAAAEVSPHRVLRARSALVDMERLLDDGTVDRAAAADRDDYAVVKAAVDEAEGAFEMVRRKAIGLFGADLAEAVADVSGGLAEKAAAAGAVIACEGPRSLRVHCDPEDLEFMVENLTANALKAVAGQPERRIALSWRREKRTAVLDVVDTGCGISPDDRDQILRRRDLDRDGGGLGLPRSGRMARRYDGNLEIVVSGPGEGTTFRLTLRVAENAAGD